MTATGGENAAGGSFLRSLKEFIKRLIRNSGYHKHVFVIIRYSVLTTHDKGWVLARENPFEEYKNKVMDPARLSQRENLFANVTLPSIVAMNPNPSKFTLVLLTSDLLPQQYRERLEDLLQPYS